MLSYLVCCILSGKECVLDFMFVYIFIVGEDSIIKGKAWDFINLFNPAYLKPGPGDPTAYVVVISCYYLIIWYERWLFVLLILLEFFTITIKLFIHNV